MTDYFLWAGDEDEGRDNVYDGVTPAEAMLKFANEVGDDHNWEEVHIYAREAVETSPGIWVVKAGAPVLRSVAGPATGYEMGPVKEE